MTRTLYSIYYSPWSIRAKWALEYHQIKYNKVEYVPMVSEAKLRLKLKRWSGKVTVPVLFDGTQVFTDSVDIVKHADDIGQGGALWRSEERFDRIVQLADVVTDSGRALTTKAVLRDPESQVDALPPFIPKSRFTAPVATSAARYLAKKYEFEKQDDAELSERMRSAIDELVTLRDDEFFFDRFSYADIAVATSLQFLRPVEHYVKLGDVLKRCWVRPYASEYGPLLEWRDRIFDQFHWRSERRKQG